MSENQESEKWPDWYYDFLAWVEREKPDIDLQDARRVWEAAVNSDMEWCFNAMKVNQDSFNRAFLIDFMKEVKQDIISKGVEEKAAPKVLIGFVPLLQKYGLSEAQINDILRD